MSSRLQADEATALMTFLSARLQGWSRTKVKRRLQAGCVTVNGERVSRHDHALQVGDRVEVLALGESPDRRPAGLVVLHSDGELIAIDKPAGLLSVASDSGSRPHALEMLRTQLSKPRQPMKLWPCHRLDRETSGVLLFATSRDTRDAVTAAWADTKKEYLAVVQGCPDPPQGTIDQPLRMDAKGYRAHVGEHSEAKRAITHFQVRSVAKDRALLDVRIETGRQHQIRAHLAWLRHPVLGDSRYGVAGGRMGLHASRLTVTLPATCARLTIEAPPPDEFLALLK